jgi:addiction module RelB/DinJ family antitoxin
MKTAAVHSRIEPETKKMAEGILRKLGLSPTEAIRLFWFFAIFSGRQGFLACQR